MYFYMLYIQCVSQNKRSFAPRKRSGACWDPSITALRRSGERIRDTTQARHLLQPFLLSSGWLPIMLPPVWNFLMEHLLCLVSLVLIPTKLLAFIMTMPSHPCTIFIDRRKQSSFRVAEEETQSRRPLSPRLLSGRGIYFFNREKEGHVCIPFVLHESRQSMNKIFTSC